jgi:hypothetical protein
VTVAPDDSGQVSAPILGGLRGLGRKGASPDESVVRREVCPIRFRATTVAYVLPAAIRQIPVIPTRDKLGAVLERDAIRRLDYDPLVEDDGVYISAIFSIAARSINSVPDL